MTDHANELRRYSRKIGHPAGDVPSVMLAAADEIERLAARLEAAEKERDALRNEIACVKEVEFPRKAQAVADAWKGKCKRLEAERDALHAKIEQMEKQEPAGEVVLFGERLKEISWRKGKLPDVGTKLYARPVPAPSVPEGWKLVPTAESRHPGIYKMLGALHAIDNTRGASEWESYAAMLAAAPKPKS